MTKIIVIFFISSIFFQFWLEGSRYGYFTEINIDYPSVCQLDLSTNEIFRRFNLSQGAGPVPVNVNLIAITPNYDRLVVTDYFNIVSIINLINGQILNLSSTLLSEPGAVAITPDGKTAIFTSLVNDKLVSLNLITNQFTEIDNNGFLFDYTYDIAITPNGKKAFITNNGNSVLLLDLISLKIINKISLESLKGTAGVAISSDGLKVFICNHASTTISVIDVQTQSFLYDITGFISDNKGPFTIALSPNDNIAYVLSGPPSQVKLYKLDTTTNMIENYIFTESNLFSRIAFNLEGSILYIISLNPYLRSLNVYTNEYSVIPTFFAPFSMAITPLPYTKDYLLTTYELFRALQRFSPVKYQKSY